MMAIRWAGRHAWLGWLLCVPVAWQLLDWIIDREPPFAALGAAQASPVRAGGTVVFIAAVRRDLDRDCTVQFSRHLIDGLGIRHDFAADPRVMTADGLREMDSAMGHQLRLAVNIPAGAAPGPATYTSDLIYRCNPVHVLWPIAVSMPLRFHIDP